MTKAPIGWYPDPDDPSRQRWWQGTQWSETYRTVEQAINKEEVVHE